MDKQDEFYQLIPRGEDFYRRPESSSEEFEEELADSLEGIPDVDQDVDQYKDQLLFAFGYQNKRKNDLEQVLYVKPLFILHNAFPVQSDDQKRALNMLVADRDLLFKEGDRYYRSKCLNRGPISMQKALDRAFKSQKTSSDVRNDLIERVIEESECDLDSCLDIKEIKLGRALVKRLLPIFLTALQKQRLSPYRWLYSKKHIGITMQNKLEYCYRYLTYQSDGYIDKEIFEKLSKLEHLDLKKQSEGVDALQILPELKDHEKEWEQFIDYVVAQKNPSDTWLLDADACIHSVKEILFQAQEKLDLSCPNQVFFHVFIEKYLVRYIQMESSLREQMPEGRAYCDPQRVSAGISGFQKRFQRIEALRKKCDEMPVPKYRKKHEIDTWGLTKCDNNEADAQLYRNLSCAVQHFFLQIASPLRISSSDDKDYLLQRITWCMRVSEFEPYELYQKPVQLLKMMYACNKYITTDRDIPFYSTQPARFYSREQVSAAIQHYAELIFLHLVHLHLGLNESTRAQSWHWYFQWRGRLFYPETEALLWEKFLNGAYENVPDIGLLLCFLEYRDNCINPHVEDLSYIAVGKAHRGGFSQFYQEHAQEIKPLITMLDNYKEVVDTYKKLWHSPQCSNRSKPEVLKKLCPKFEACSIIKACPEEEYKCLVLETAIRLWICNQAKEKLLTWFCSLYDWKWRKETECPELLQGGFPIKE